MTVAVPLRLAICKRRFWYLQGEAGLVNGGADGTAFYNAAVTALGGAGNAANGAYGVVALNLWDSSNNGAQDQLMVVPGPSSVPEPGAASFGLLFLLLPGMYKVRAFIRRQKG